jgi:bifunctional non-homologous end joining protein LigD
MRLRLVKEAFNDPEYIFELKNDGFRALAYIERGECRLVSRNLKHLRFDALEEALATLPAHNAIIDGEIVCLDANGVSQFNELLNRKAEPVLYAFELLWLNGEDRRRRLLRDLRCPLPQPHARAVLRSRPLAPE